MNFFGKKAKENRRREEELKAMFERKFCLAKSDPDSTFDLSDCGLKNVPSSVFKFVRVLRKTSLFLQNNDLKLLGSKENIKDLEFLEALNVSCNQLTELPYEMKFFKFLKILDVSNNQLLRLPDTLCEVVSLEILNLSSNKLKNLPESIGKLKRLSLLDLKNNSDLRILPASLHHAYNLKEIGISDNQAFLHPPQSIIVRGVPEILHYLAKDCHSGCEELVDEKLPSQNEQEAKLLSSLSLHHELEAKLKIQEYQRAEKAKEKLMFEEQLSKQKHFELKKQQGVKKELEKKKLLQEIINEQALLGKRIKQLHLKKRQERTELLSYLQETEKLADSVINQLLISNRDALSFEGKLQQEEDDKKLQEQLLKNHFDKTAMLRSEVVFEAMLNSIASENQFKKISCDRETTLSELQSKSVESEEKKNDILHGLLTNRDSDRKELIALVKNDEELQKNAVIALLKHSDIQSLKLSHDIQNVEKQLAQMTLLEMEKRKLNAVGNIVDLCEKRLALSQLLEALLRHKDERKMKLLYTMELLQNQHSNQITNADYWLQQYQKLLRLMPGDLRKAQLILDSRLVHHLAEAEVAHCSPFIAHCINAVPGFHNISEDDLEQAGIILDTDRQKVMEALRNFRADTEAPSAPELHQGVEESTSPTAPLINECVVCFDKEISIVFADCGHCCCCDTCAVPLELCPLCRTTLHKKIRIHY